MIKIVVLIGILNILFISKSFSQNVDKSSIDFVVDAGYNFTNPDPEPIPNSVGLAYKNKETEKGYSFSIQGNLNFSKISFAKKIPVLNLLTISLGLGIKENQFKILYDYQTNDASLSTEIRDYVIKYLVGMLNFSKKFNIINKWNFDIGLGFDYDSKTSQTVDNIETTSTKTNIGIRPNIALIFNFSEIIGLNISSNYSIGLRNISEFGDINLKELKTKEWNVKAGIRIYPKWNF